MKKAVVTFMLLTLVLSLTACGDVSSVKTHEVESSMYSQEDIASAENVIKNNFVMEWSGCTLTELYYGGDELSKAEQDYYSDIHNVDQVLVLESSFDVVESGADKSLEPGKTYTGWKWIMGRNTGDKWKLIEQGY